VPIAASASASAAKIPSSSARNRGRAAESENTCSIVRSLTIGSVGSCARTASEIARASVSSGRAERTAMFMLPGAKPTARGP
jgi:hypothetical protein